LFEAWHTPQYRSNIPIPRLMDGTNTIEIGKPSITALFSRLLTSFPQSLLLCSYKLHHTVKSTFRGSVYHY
jgi:hypothetical protein